MPGFKVVQGAVLAAQNVVPDLPIGKKAARAFVRVEFSSARRWVGLFCFGTSRFRGTYFRVPWARTTF